MSNSFLEIQKLLTIDGEFALSDITSLSSEAVNLLGEEEKREFELCKNVKRQQEFVSSRITLKQMATQLGAGEEFQILKDDLGQPFGNGKSQCYYVSIAHTDEQVFCGLSANDPIGVDLEPIDRTVPSRLEQRISHPQEKTLLDDISVIRLWTIKEAYIKLRGQGLRMNMNEVKIARESDHIFAELNNDKRAKICSFRMKNNWLAIAHFD